MYLVDREARHQVDLILETQRVGLSQHRRRESLDDRSADIPVNMSGRFLRQLLRKDPPPKDDVKASSPLREEPEPPRSWKRRTRQARQYQVRAIA